ncbi:hypothetical protein M9H77_31920 [Catharanthus roseus]|uniref:Uncharacterized protein n=1 Tax=Catharanthus roseus TaxID=4058 RepID=A0ACC0A1I2_CATRO|nr:hypothetical protein M9H77_31920 [Catharanthus roseus]
MENDRKPSDVKRESSEDDNVNGFRWPLVSGQNSNAIPGAEYDIHGTGLPIVAAQIANGSTSQQPQGNQNVANVPMDSPPSSPLIHAEIFNADPSDMVNFLDQIMGGRAPSSGFNNSNDNSSIRANAIINATPIPSLFTPPEHNTRATQATTNYMANSVQTGFSSSNYYFPVNNSMQQPSIYASNMSPNCQGIAPGNHFGQYATAPPPAIFNPQLYNSFVRNASPTPLRPRQPSPGSNQRMNVDPRILGNSLNRISQREAVVRHDLGTNASSSSSEQGSSNRTEMLKHIHFDNVYDPRYADYGLPVDPFLRMLQLKPDFS